MNLALIKQKKVYIPLIIVVGIGLVSIRSYRKSHAPPEYETMKVSRAALEQTVEATGKIQSVDDLSLRFEIPGTLTSVKVKPNTKVKKGTVLANLRLSELNASVAQASANLRQKLAGASEQDRAYYAAAVDAGLAALEQAKVDAVTGVKVAEGNVETAKNNLQLAVGGDNSQIITTAYENAIAAIKTAVVKLDDALVQADAILGVDNVSSNDSFEISLSPSNPTLILQAKMAYEKTKSEVTRVRTQVTTITNPSNHSEIESALTTTDSALSLSVEMLSSVSAVLQNTQPSGSLSASELSTKQTTITTARAASAAQYTTIIGEKQDIVAAKNSYSNYTLAYAKAEQDLDTARATADSNVKLKEAAYNQAVANHQTRILPPREVDVAYYRATLSQAVAARDKAIIRAPIDGIVTKVNKKIGELVSSGDVMIEMLSPRFEVKVDIPETDVSKLQMGDEATVTLDAFGEETKFVGTILVIEPGSTEIQDVVYYKVTVGLADTDKPIKSGMTANVSIKTDSRENALFVPSRAIRTRDDGTKYVRVFVREKERDLETTVKVGLRADGAKVEILEGLEEGQEVIVGTKT